MEFVKSKVYTPFNYDEVKAGSKGYFSDSRDSLIGHVEADERTINYGILKEVASDGDLNYPFQMMNGTESWHFFYLVEEPHEPVNRPCTREEFLEKLQKQGLPMVLHKDNGFTYSIIRLNDDEITVMSVTGSYITYNYIELYEKFTLLDRTELCMKE